MTNLVSTGTLNCALLEVINLVAQGVELTGNFRTTGGIYFADLWAGVFKMGITTEGGVDNEFVGLSTSSTDANNGSGLINVFDWQNGAQTIGTQIVGDAVETKDVTVKGTLYLDGASVRPGTGQNILAVDWVWVPTSDGGTCWALASPET